MADTAVRLYRLDSRAGRWIQVETRLRDFGPGATFHYIYGADGPSLAHAALGALPETIALPVSVTSVLPLLGIALPAPLAEGVVCFNTLMICCPDLEKLMDLDMARRAQPWQLTNGRILTEIDTEYYFVFGEERPSFVGINYCPFCGRALSRGLWNLEKKKQGI